MNLRRVAAGLALAGAMAMGLGAGAAQAAAGQTAATANLKIVPQDGEYLVVVYGQAPEGRAPVRVNLYAQDEEESEHLYGPLKRTSNSDGSYRITFRVEGDLLDEDEGQDEIYALVRFNNMIFLTTNVWKYRF